MEAGKAEDCWYDLDVPVKRFAIWNGRLVSPPDEAVSFFELLGLPHDKAVAAVDALLAEGDDALTTGVQDRKAPRHVGNRRVMPRPEPEEDRAPRPSEPHDEDDLG